MDRSAILNDWLDTIQELLDDVEEKGQNRKILSGVEYDKLMDGLMNAFAILQDIEEANVRY